MLELEVQRAVLTRLCRSLGIMAETEWHKGV